MGENWNQRIIDSLEGAMAQISSALEENAKELDRDNPKNFETQKSYEKFLQDLADQLLVAINELKDNPNRF